MRKALVPSVLIPEKLPDPAAGLNGEFVVLAVEVDPKAKPVPPNDVGAPANPEARGEVVEPAGGDLAFCSVGA